MDQNNSIFLAYAREDEGAVKQLYSKLKANGLQPWMDQEDLNPGEHWKETTDEALKNARFFLACLSNRSKSKSGYGQRELRLALSEVEKKMPGERWLIPVLLEDIELPHLTVGTVRLSDYQAVNIFEEKGLQKLIMLLKTEMNKDTGPSANFWTVAKTTERKALQKLPTQPKQASTDEKAGDPQQNIQNHIAEDRISDALNLLKTYAEKHRPEWTTDVILLTSRYRNLEKQQRRGVISREQQLLEKNRITHAVLGLAERLR